MTIKFLNANGSARSEGDVACADAQLDGDEGDWRCALRFVNFPAGQWTAVTIHHATRLPADTHAITWSCTVNRDSVAVDGGSLTVIARSSPAAAESSVASTQPAGALLSAGESSLGSGVVPPRIALVRQNEDGDADDSRQNVPAPRRRPATEAPSPDRNRANPSSGSQGVRQRVIDALLEITRDSGELLEVRLQSMQTIMRVLELPSAGLRLSE